VKDHVDKKYEVVFSNTGCHPGCAFAIDCPSAQIFWWSRGPKKLVPMTFSLQLKSPTRDLLFYLFVK
jgi:hypothetical protein